MRTQILLIFVALFLFANTAFPQTSALSSDFQSWNEVQLILLLVSAKDAKGNSFDKVTATLNGVLRIGRRNFDFLDNRIGTTVDFRVNRHLSLLTGFLYRKDGLVKNRRRYETRFSVGATFFGAWRGFAFRDRNMFEHRFRNSRNDPDLYRQRVQVSYPLKFKRKELFSPFISEEGYYDLRLRKWIQNEFFAGVTRNLLIKPQ